MGEVTFRVESIKDVLSKNLRIPDYQRGYKWDDSNVRNLFEDVDKGTLNDKEYRLGSIILHENEEDNKVVYDIVDGQQRLLSFALLLHAESKNIDEKYEGANSLLDQTYSKDSADNAYRNCELLRKLLSENKDQNEEMQSNESNQSTTSQLIDRFMNHCKVSVIKLPKDNLGEAFQLFDTQNSRGVDLYPHDLLKAYHLRAIEHRPNEEDNQEEVINKWESYINQSNDGMSLSLSDLFDKHLYRTRKWVNGERGLIWTTKRRTGKLEFTANSIEMFKGVGMEEAEKYPYLSIYTKLMEENKDPQYSITMPIIDGEHFFKYIEYCYELYNDILYSDNCVVSNKKMGALIEELKKKEEINVNSNYYSRNTNLFYNSVALYLDRFHYIAQSNDKKELELEPIDIKVIEQLQKWSIKVRNKKRVSDPTIANYAKWSTIGRHRNSNMFKEINNAVNPERLMENIREENEDEK